MNVVLLVVFCCYGLMSAESLQVSVASSTPSPEKKGATPGASAVKPLPTVPGEPVRTKQAEFTPVTKTSEIPSLDVGDFTIDEIKAIVSGPLQEEVITLSDIERRGFTGERDITLEKIVQERCADQRGEKMHYTITNEDVERYLKSMSPSGEFDRSQIEAIAKQWGFTIEEFYEELKRLYRAMNVTSHEMQSKLEVTEAEARTYYEKHPEEVEGKYIIQTFTIPFGVENAEEYMKKAPEGLWGEVIDIDWQDLPEDKAFIKQMRKGEMRLHASGAAQDAYKVVDIIQPTVVPFAVRKADIVTLLKQEKMNTAMAQQAEEATEGYAVFYPRNFAELTRELAQSKK